ncbi:hypothetical protein, partial [uncultured Methanobrevibacter sp.]|uniref:hypothetical protein n=1 Tax=uncultured Methanobrevibacter sp. TaxID=253161 RepID=UPI0025FF027D
INPRKNNKDKSLLGLSWPAVRGYRLENINIPLIRGYVKKSRIPNFLKVGGSSIRNIFYC